MNFESFTSFFTNNLLQLEREKHIQILQKSLHAKEKRNQRSNTIQVMTMDKIASSKVNFQTHLETIFKLADTETAGFLPRTEFEKLLKSLNMSISAFQIECLLSEVTVNDVGHIEYESLIPVLADILAVST